MSEMVPMYGFGGSGGGGLNFKVVGGTTQPTNPTENTIWVNTSVSITDWVFSATEPTTPVEGMVWISTGKTSPAGFNALKKNGLQVYPLSAKQYISGALVNKVAKSYQGGEWVDWSVYLLNGAGLCEDITGGWVQDPNTSMANLSNTGTVTFSDEGIHVGDQQCTVVRTKNPIDLSNYKTLTALLKADKVFNNISIRLFIFKTISKTIDEAPDGALINVTETEFTNHYVDLSTMSGKFYIALASSQTSGWAKQIFLS